MSSIPAREVAAVYERAGGLCEACTWPLSGFVVALHHRHPKGSGGSKLPWINTAVNLMLVHGDLGLNCHNLAEYSIHARPTRSYRLNHLVHRGQHPGDFPVIGEPNLRSVLL